VAIVLHATLGGSSFLPAADNGMLIVNAYFRVRVWNIPD
jgi:hypothetical protein